jgi:hypothetical protein
LPVIVTADQFPAEIRRRLAADTERLRLVALEVAQQSIADAVRETNAAGAVDQGFYKLSWSARAHPRGAELINTAPYAAVLEYGRRPGRPGPPLAPILAWVKRKLVGNGSVKPEDAYGVALAIRQRIHDRGTRPRRILQKVVLRMGPRLRLAARRELSRPPR